jgi:hypothetical protein
MPDIGNSAIFSQSDASNNTGTMPGWNGGFAPSTLDDAGRALQGAITRQWYWQNYTALSTGSGIAYVLTYSVAPAALYSGQAFRFKAHAASTGAAFLNINGLGLLAIKKDLYGVLTATAAGDIAIGQSIEVYYNGTDFTWTNFQPALTSLASTTEVLTGTDAAKAVTADALAALWERGTDVASAGTISLGEGGYFNITGTTTITDIDFATDKAGRCVWVKFAGILTLTHNAATLILPGGVNIITAAGDTACLVSEGSDVIRCVAYNPASGLAIIQPSTYTSANLTCTAGTIAGGAAQAHGLGAIPAFVSLTLVCTTADAGYAVGARLKIESSSINVDGYGLTMQVDATNITIRIAAGGIRIIDTTFNQISITASSWRLVITARL